MRIYSSYTSKEIVKILRAQVDADNNALNFTYSGEKLQSVRDVFQRSITLTYDGDLLDTVTDSTGRSVSYEYTNGNLTGFRDLENKLWQYGYDTKHRMTTLTNPLSITTATNTYDELDRVKTQTVPRKINGSIVNRTYNLYFSGYRNIEEDTEGNQTVYYFDDKGRTLSTENALGNRSYTEYDGQNHVVKTTDLMGNEVEFRYDSNHNITFTSDAYQNETEYVYDGLFRRTDEYDPMNHRIHYEYDTEHHLTDTIVYPEAGKQIATSQIYYNNGLIHTTRDGMETVSTMTYDSFGNLDTAQTNTQPLVNYNYNPVGLLTSLTDQANATTSFTYDDRGLLSTKTDPLLKNTTFTYYDDGSVNTITDRNGDIIDYDYTPSGKTDTITYIDNGGGPSFQVSYGYDARDNLRTINSPTGTILNDYNVLSRITNNTNPHGFSVGYGYDESGNLTTLTYPGNKTVTYTYDDLNRLETVSINWINKTATYYYDSASKVTGFDQFNGTIVNFDYDNAGRLTDLENTTGGGTPIATYHFVLDNNGNRKHINKTEPLEMTLSPVNTNYTYNSQKNRLLSASGTSFTYDDEGQLASKGGTAYGFDVAHRLVNVGGTTPSQYVYDGSNNRIQATRNGAITRYIYSASGQLLAEADVNNVIQRYYIYGKGLMAVVTAGGQIYCYHFDANANTIAMTDSGQNIVNKYVYAPFGLAANSQETVAQPFKYVGQYGVVTEPNGLYYMKARYYDPDVGRFLSEDPLGFDGGDFNLYVYAMNNPIMFMDPNGLCSESTTYNSGTFLRTVVPGQIAWDNAMTDFAQGNYVGSAINTTAMLGEQVMTVLTVGQGRQISAATSILTATRAKIAIHAPHHSFGSLGKLSHIQIIIWKEGVKGTHKILRIPLPWR
ncbi:MAG: RHS repeat-associated core domain-containing protein [Deltaproteobacteria bacterium]|nr:RHS repeat-associated core domain-containing protein [Deltaproteobacteria bacterium]